MLRMKRLLRCLRPVVSGLRVSLTLAALAMLIPDASAFAQAKYPTRSIRIIVAFAPGGIADIIGRLLGDKLNATLGQSVVVENRGGAGGGLAAKLVSSEPGDGYTLLITTTAVAINAVAMKGAVDPRTQLTPIALVASAPMIFVANRTVTAPDLMQYVRGINGGNFTYCTSGVGTAEHLTSAYIFKVTPGLQATHVPFSGGVAILNAVLGNQVDLTTATIPPALPFLKDGSLRVLAVAAHQRLPMLPDAPALKEIGFPDLENASWIALFGPPGLPDDIANMLNSQVNRALKQPDVSERLTTLGFALRSGSQPEFATYLKDEVAKWREIVQTTGFTLN